MPSRRSALVVTTTSVADTFVLRAYGRLDSATYFRLRHAIQRAAREKPRAVIVDVSSLVVEAPSKWAVFTSSGWRVPEWPAGVVIALVCNNVAGQKALLHNGISRYLPVYWSVAAAVGALSDDNEQRYRRRAHADLPPAKRSLGRCRELIGQWLTAWSKTDYVRVVSLVAQELVDNALTHAHGGLSLRLEASTTTVLVTVHDTSTDVALTRKPTEASSGLGLVAAHSRAWGNVPTSAGKTVWALIGPENRL